MQHQIYQVLSLSQDVSKQGLLPAGTRGICRHCTWIMKVLLKYCRKHISSSQNMPRIPNHRTATEYKFRGPLAPEKWLDLWVSGIEVSRLGVEDSRL